jgi:choline dehydrogenase-like flavoprotein
VLADKEVIVAAGAPLTPQLLQISGVGPKTLLKSLGIPVVSDLPGVGANFHDHPTLFVGANFMNDMNPSPSNTTNTTWMGEQEALYQSSREGMFGRSWRAKWPC